MNNIYNSLVFKFLMSLFGIVVERYFYNKYIYINIDVNPTRIFSLLPYRQLKFSVTMKFLKINKIIKCINVHNERAEFRL